MQITSVEVIKRNLAPGSPVAIRAIPGEKLELTYGETLQVNVSFDYRGPAPKATLYGAIGVRGVFFNEILANTRDISLPPSPMEFTPGVASVDIAITSEISPGTGYDLYVKLLEYPEAGVSEVDNVIDITGIPPTYELIQHTIYPFAYIYDGDVEMTTATFKTDPFTPSAWMGEEFASKLEEEVRARGGRVLEAKVYVDTTPLLWTNFRIEVTGTPLEGGMEAAAGVSVGIALWLAIILVCLAIIAVIVVATLMWERFMGTFKTYPGLHDVKPGWGKETLMLTIHDSEEYWERPLTPTETLEGMSEAELRDYLDKIAEEEVPDKVDWGALAILGGLAVLGVGAAVVFTAGRGE